MKHPSTQSNRTGWAYVNSDGIILLYTVARSRSQTKFNAVYHPLWGCDRVGESWQTFKRRFRIGKCVRIKIQATEIL
jgi:hypothetical protein